MSKTTPLVGKHQQINAKLVDFAGWLMPLHYGSQLDEHHKVRQHAGMFDVSHMGIIDVVGEDASSYLRKLLANDVIKLSTHGKALYTCMLNEQGGIIDDLIVYYLDDNYYRLVVNAGTREKDLQWLHQHTNEFKVNIAEKNDLAMIAIQGPQAIDKTIQILPPSLRDTVKQLRSFHAVANNDWLIARTGYTGEDGLEVQVPSELAATFWQALIDEGVQPCGLGARDTLRLEAGLNLYGVDMDESTSPLESNLEWTVAWEPQDRPFIGRAALTQQKHQGVKRKLVGLVLESNGILRNHQKVSYHHDPIGEITSGTFSPTLGHAIAFARVTNADALNCEVEIRNKSVPVRMVNPPFVRKGQKVYK